MDRSDLDELNIPLLNAAQVHELPDTPSCLDLSPDGQRLAAATYEEGVFILEANLAVLRQLAGHAGGTLSARFAGGGALLVTSGEDGHCRVWDVASGELRAALSCPGIDADKGPHGHTVAHVVVNEGGELAACAAGKTVHLIPLEGQDLEEERQALPPVSGGVVEALRFLESGALLGSYYGGISIWGTRAGVPSMDLPYETAIYSLDASPDLSWVVGGCLDACVHIWNLTHAPSGGAGAGASGGGGGDASDSGSCSDGEGGGEEGDKGGAHVVEFSCGGYDGKVTALDFNHERRLMASAGGVANTVWDFSGEGPAGTMPTVALGHAKSITCQAWQPGPPGLLATGGRDGRVLVFDLRRRVGGGGGDRDGGGGDRDGGGGDRDGGGGGEEDEDAPTPYLCLPAALAHTEDEVVSLVWSADGGVLFSAHVSGAVRCWATAAAAPPPAGEK